MSEQPYSVLPDPIDQTVTRHSNIIVWKINLIGA